MSPGSKSLPTSELEDKTAAEEAEARTETETEAGTETETEAGTEAGTGTGTGTVVPSLCRPGAVAVPTPGGLSLAETVATSTMPTANAARNAETLVAFTPCPFR